MGKRVIVSAGDAITAKLIKQAGFQGIWISGFEASARLGIPDNGSITMTEMLSIAKPIVNAVNLPVYVDVDTGYGNLNRTIREFQHIGVKGICVEDNLPVKKNSLWGEQEPILDKDVFAEKIYLGRKTKNKNFELIARTEALIRKFGFDEAIDRALLYFQSGADRIVIHTRDESGSEVLTIGNEARIKHIPKVIIPTKFPFIKTQTLFEYGFSMVVWANQTERVKIKAIRESLDILQREDCAYLIERNLSASLDDMKGLMPDE